MNSSARPDEQQKARRARLNKVVIVKEACLLLDEEGRDALTMARLGERLGVTPMAVYRHFADKRELVDAVTESVLADLVGADAAEEGWAAGVSRWMHQLRQHWLEHPWIGSFLGTPTELSGSWIALSDQLAALLESAGLPPRLVARELVFISRTTAGIVLLELSAPLPGAAKSAAMTSSLDAARRKSWLPISRALAKYDDDRLFADLVESTLTRLTELSNGQASRAALK